MESDSGNKDDNNSNYECYHGNVGVNNDRILMMRKLWKYDDDWKGGRNLKVRLLLWLLLTQMLMMRMGRVEYSLVDVVISESFLTTFYTRAVVVCCC